MVGNLQARLLVFEAQQVNDIGHAFVSVEPRGAPVGGHDAAHRRETPLGLCGQIARFRMPRVEAEGRCLGNLQVAQRGGKLFRACDEIQGEGHVVLLRWACQNLAGQPELPIEVVGGLCPSGNEDFGVDAKQRFQRKIAIEQRAQERGRDGVNLREIGRRRRWLVGHHQQTLERIEGPHDVVLFQQRRQLLERIAQHPLFGGAFRRRLGFVLEEPQQARSQWRKLVADEYRVGRQQSFGLFQDPSLVFRLGLAEGQCLLDLAHHGRGIHHPDPEGVQRVSVHEVEPAP